jgi:hypothetical protein
VPFGLAAAAVLERHRLDVESPLVLGRTNATRLPSGEAGLDVDGAVVHQRPVSPVATSG